MPVHTRNFQDDVTLQRIYDVANEDVEMKDAYLDTALYLVLDTNVLIDHLNVIQSFARDVETLSLPVKIIIPNVLLSELDGLKNQERLQWFARTASTWLLEKVKERKAVKVQSREETAHIKSHDESRKNDLAIYDCCVFFRGKGRIVLVSGDRNLCLECEKDEIPTLLPPRRHWSSQDLARTLFQHNAYVDISGFEGHQKQPKYRASRSDAASARLGATEPPEARADDWMDIDDDDSFKASPAEEFVPSHALDSLHLQVIDHFAVVLKETAVRVGTAAGDLSAPSLSQYAPAWRRKHYRTWTVGDCLEYLNSKRALRVSNPSLRVFLLRRNEDRGWRRGQDWSRQDWINSLAALREIGEKFEDEVVLKSLAALSIHVEDIFRTPMRPTGI